MKTYQKRPQSPEPQHLLVGFPSCFFTKKQMVGRKYVVCLISAQGKQRVKSRDKNEKRIGIQNFQMINAADTAAVASNSIPPSDSIVTTFGTTGTATATLEF
jgi:hypothetical protein